MYCSTSMTTMGDNNEPREDFVRDDFSSSSSSSSSLGSDDDFDPAAFLETQTAEAAAAPATRRFWFRSRSAATVTNDAAAAPPPTPAPTATPASSMSLDFPYEQMLQMTLELVDDIYLNLRPGDSVLTRYGRGVVVQANTVLRIRLDWGATLHCPDAELVHKLLTPQEYERAMEHLEEIRKLSVAIQCHEWGIPVEKQPPEACLACLFQKPELHNPSRRKKRHTHTATNNNQQRASYWRRGRSSSTASTNSSSSASASSTNPSSGARRTQRCDVCGNPVCRQHKIAMGEEVEYFAMCVDCSNDLHQSHQNIGFHHPQLLQNLQRLVQYYTRMSLQLVFCIPNLKPLQEQLTHKQKRDGAISLGNSALGFVGAALGVAGAAAMLTPAGPAILLAAVATSATSGTFQSMHMSYNKFLSNKTANQLADKCLGWHGLCLGILQALETLRLELLAQEHEMMDYSKVSSANHRKQSQRVAQNQQQQNQQKHLEIWNTLAMGSFSTTRSAMTGVGVTSAMGASYSQAINTSLQTLPVVGAAFGVGCMAMDANNMASSLKQLNTPAKKAVALQGVEQSFARHVVTTIAPRVAVIVQATQDLQERMAEREHAEERARIEQELQGLGGDWKDEDEDLERELRGL